MTAANIFASQLYHRAVASGLDGDKLLQAAGISRELIDVPDRRVETEKVAVIVESIWEHLQDESMGLSNSPIPRGSFHMMGKVAIHEPKLGRSLQMGIQFYSLVTKAFTTELVVEGDVATLKFHMSAPELDSDHLFAEINLMAWHRFASWLISENVTLNDIFFDYAAPAHVSEYAYLYPGKHRFSKSFQGFSFHSNFLEREVSQSVSSLNSFIKRCPVEFFMQPTTDFSVAFGLQKRLKSQLSDGFPVIEDAAKTLHMTKRTLMRKLKDEGTSYQQIKDLVRRDRAIYLLTQHSMPLGDIAEAVGFSDPAVFARAFKGWTGVSPREYRLESERSQ
jgi:AraC-like DNA-binding protein